MEELQLEKNTKQVRIEHKEILNFTLHVTCSVTENW